MRTGVWVARTERGTAKLPVKQDCFHKHVADPNGFGVKNEEHPFCFLLFFLQINYKWSKNKKKSIQFRTINPCLDLGKKKDFDLKTFIFHNYSSRGSSAE